jgi:hypothetical protein
MFRFVDLTCHCSHSFFVWKRGKLWIKICSDDRCQFVSRKKERTFVTSRLFLIQTATIFSLTIYHFKPWRKPLLFPPFTYPNKRLSTIEGYNTMVVIIKSNTNHVLAVVVLILNEIRCVCHYVVDIFTFYISDIFKCRKNG